MPIFNIPASAPLSFLFFVAAAIAVHFGSDAEALALRLFGRSAFLLFVALGPLRWAETLVYSLQIPWPDSWDWGWYHIEDIPRMERVVEWASGLSQIALLVLAFLDGKKAVGALAWL